MTDISKRLSKIVSKTLAQNPILPVKTPEGILVGDVLITNKAHLKDIYKNGRLIYKEISLNDIAIKIANLLAQNKGITRTDQLYRADQDYGRWFTECQILRDQHRRFLSKNDGDKADYLWAKYIEAKSRADKAKKHALGLIAF